MGADGWRQILISRDFGDVGSHLRKATVLLIKKICLKEISDLSLSTLLASRLVPLNENLGLCQ